MIEYIASNVCVFNLIKVWDMDILIILHFHPRMICDESSQKKMAKMCRFLLVNCLLIRLVKDEAINNLNKGSLV